MRGLTRVSSRTLFGTAAPSFFTASDHVLDDREIDTCDACDFVIRSLSCESTESAQCILTFA
jgi:hypothetical protein